MGFLTRSKANSWEWHAMFPVPQRISLLTILCSYWSKAWKWSRTLLDINSAIRLLLPEVVIWLIEVTSGTRSYTLWILLHRRVRRVYIRLSEARSSIPWSSVLSKRDIAHIASLYASSLSQLLNRHLSMAASIGKSAFVTSLCLAMLSIIHATNSTTSANWVGTSIS